jgi:hypothetical protein
VSETDYNIEDSNLLIDITQLGIISGSATLNISYDVLIKEENSDAIGLINIKNRINALDERISVMGRRYMMYENAYK